MVVESLGKASLSSLFPGIVAAASVAEDGRCSRLDSSAATVAASSFPTLLPIVLSASPVPFAAAAQDGDCHSAVADEDVAPLSGVMPAAMRWPRSILIMASLKRPPMAVRTITLHLAVDELSLRLDVGALIT